MKKKIFSLLLVICLAVPALILGGCEKSLNFNEYSNYSTQALKNSYNYILTDKNDLTTHGDFTFTKTEVNKTYEEEQLVETVTTTTTQQRKGQGTDTVYVVTTEVKTSEYNDGTQQYDETTTITKEIYTKIVTDDVTTYHKLREYTNANGETTKSVTGTYLETVYITTVYNLSEDAFDEISELHPNTEFALIVMIGEYQAKGDENHGVFELTYSATEYRSKVVIETEMVGEFEYKDAKLYKGCQTNTTYSNDVTTAQSEQSYLVEYTCEVTTPTSLADYVA